MDTLLQVAASWILPALFFWFLFSLIAMILLEVIQRLDGSRQKGLQEIIQELMGSDLREDFNQNALTNPLEGAKPAYISGSLFAKVIMDWMLQRPDGRAYEKQLTKDALYKIMQSNIKSLAEKNAEFGRVLRAVVLQAYLKTEKLSEFLDAIEKDLVDWFYETVNQMSPIYGARLQRFTVLVSVLVAFVANFDVINITVRLWETSKYGELLDLVGKTGQTIQLDTSQITRLPVGWYIDNLPSGLAAWLLKVIGLFLGAFFVALGSQYVYNLFRRQYQPAK
jgi:hypothetical protein